MDLPPELRAAIDQALEGHRASALAEIADRQSDTYRHRADQGLPRLLVGSDADALAYAAWRLPATFGAATAALEALAAGLPDFRAETRLDLGSGPGTVLHAATAVFGAPTSALAIEGAAPFRDLARGLFEAIGADAGPVPEWQPGDLAQAASIAALAAAGETAETGQNDGNVESDAFDLVTLAYVQGELPTASRPALIERAWARTRGAFVIIEPGTTAGYQRLMSAREQLIEAGAHVVAPCPHAAACPLLEGDWCHFAVRIARSRTHRAVKNADLGYEDEKFAYLVVSRAEPVRARARVLRPPRVDKIGGELDICREDGAAVTLGVRKRDKAAYRVVKKLRTGDAVPDGLLEDATPI